MNLKLFALACLALLNTVGQPLHAETAHEQAARAGVRACLPALKNIEGFLAGKAASHAVLFWDREAADKGLVSALIELEGPDAHNIASLNVVPTTDGQCIAEYSQTGYINRSCVDHMKSLGDAVKFQSDLGKQAALFKGQGVTILLSNAGPGCHWVRKEVIKLAGAGEKNKDVATTKGEAQRRKSENKAPER